MSKTEFVLEASPRQDIGKGASRRLRRLNDEIPSIIYGAGKEPTSITLKHKDISQALESEAFFSQLITVSVGKTKETVVLKDLQRHPAKLRILHADFLRVSANQAIHVKIPLHFINEDDCVGVKLSGGIISHLLNELEVSCLPKDLPEYIEVFMAELDLGESIHIADLALPAGVTSVDLTHGNANNLAVAAVMKAKGSDIDEEETSEGEDNDEAGEEENAE